MNAHEHILSQQIQMIDNKNITIVRSKHEGRD